MHRFGFCPDKAAKKDNIKQILKVYKMGITHIKEE